MTITVDLAKPLFQSALAKWQLVARLLVLPQFARNASARPFYIILHVFLKVRTAYAITNVSQ